jgi:threonine dehydrogenase-like Zn-dependent dehydrogenase
LGHEICGQKLDSNQRFIVWPASTCNSCHYCKNGAENLCSSIQVIGFHRDGGFAQYIKVHTDSLIKIPDTVPSEIACMTELMSSAINAVEQVDLQKSQSVLIYGAGPAGLMLGLVCRHIGAYPFILEKSPEKIKRVAGYCKETGIPLSDQVPSENFDVAINAAPDPETFTDGISKLRAGGKYCLFSGFTKNVSVPAGLLNEVHYRQLTVVGAYGSTRRQMEKALTIIEKHAATLRPLIQKIIKLEDVPNVLPEILQGRALKYVVDLQNDGDKYGN